MCKSLMHPISSEYFACVHGTVKQYTHSYNCEIARLQQTTDTLQQCQENVILIILHKTKPEWSFQKHHYTSHV